MGQQLFTKITILHFSTLFFIFVNKTDLSVKVTLKK